MTSSNKMAGKATSAAVAERRHKLIFDAAWRHAVMEAESGRSQAVESAVAEMVGASQFLAQRLGKERARQTIVSLLEAL